MGFFSEQFLKYKQQFYECAGFCGGRKIKNKAKGR
jgi:hypothetical protein